MAFTEGNAQNIYPWNEFENYYFLRLQPHFLEASELTLACIFCQVDYETSSDEDEGEDFVDQAAGTSHSEPVVDVEDLGAMVNKLKEAKVGMWLMRSHHWFRYRWQAII